MSAMHEPSRDAPSVLVTDAARGSALAILRSLGRAGWRVVAADASRSALGFRSRFARARVVTPAPDRDPKGFVEAILAAARAHRIDLVIPVTDAAILPLSAARERFAGTSRLALPAPEALEAAWDKLRTVELGSRLGIPVPRTCLVRDAGEALACAPQLGWPLVMKPRRSCVLGETGLQSFHVAFASDADELARRMSELEGRCDVLLQAYSPGAGTGVELVCQDGRPLAAFQHERLREVPVHGGASAFRRSVPLDPALLRHSIRILAALRWTGLAMVEFKVGESGPTLMEINGRAWGSLPLASASGVDFPRLLAEVALRGAPLGEPAPLGAYRLGVRSRNPDLELVWIGSVLRGRRRYPFLPTPPRRDALRALVQLLDPRVRSDLWSLDDPFPAIASIPRLAAKLRGKLADARRAPE
jgi:predicted ATP-grasp superfamily ATP-dependent carboligase